MCSGCEVAFVLPFAPFLYFVQSVAKSEQVAKAVVGVILKKKDAKGIYDHAVE